MYQLFVYWGTCVTDLLPLLDKLSSKIKVNVMINLFSTHYFTRVKNFQEISKILTNFVNKVDREEGISFIQGVKDEYLLAASPLKIFFDALDGDLKKGIIGGKFGKFINRLLT